MKGLPLILVATLLAGCQYGHPVPVPEVVVLCLVPPDMTNLSLQPLKPTGDYSQRDVALYLVDLSNVEEKHRAQLMRIRALNDDCARRADRQGEQ